MIIFGRIMCEYVTWIWEEDNGMSHMGESKDIQETHTISMPQVGKVS